MLGLFYSLALHMHRSLGAWPNSIGEQGFPPPLVAHVNLTQWFTVALICFGVFVCPLVILASLFLPRWRRLIPYFAIYVLSFGICWGLMQLAPKQFLYWWAD
jgi:hypothetical protein